MHEDDPGREPSNETNAFDTDLLTDEEEAPLEASASVTVGAARARSALRGGDTWQEAVDAILADLAGEAPVDLAIVFADSLFGHHREISQRLHEGLQARHLIGCTGQSVIGSGLEAEDGAALSVLTLRLPGAAFTPIAVVPGETTEVDLAALSGAGAETWLMFSDPFSLNTESLVRGLQGRLSEIVLLGGWRRRTTRARARRCTSTAKRTRAGPCCWASRDCGSGRSWRRGRSRWAAR